MAETQEIHPLTKIIWSQFKRSRDFHAPEYEKIDKADKYWESSPEVVGATQDFEERIHVPMTFDAEQVLTPRIYSVITATSPPFDVQGVERTDFRGANAIRHLVGHQFELSDFDGKSIYYVRQAGVRGTTIAQVFWNRLERFITSRDSTKLKDILEKDPITGEQVVVGEQLKLGGTTTKKGKIRNHPDHEVFSVKDAFPDPDSIDFNDDLPFIRRQKTSIQKMKEWNEVAEALGMDKFESLDKLEEDIKKKAKKDEEFTTQIKITLLHYWGLLNLTSNKIEVEEKLKNKVIPSWVTIGYTEDNDVVSEKYFMRAIPNPNWHARPPFVKSVWIKKKVPSWFGIGIAESGESSADRINTIVSMRMDNIKRIIHKRFKYNILDTNLDLDAAESAEPGGGIGMSDVRNSMEWEVMPDLSQSSYLEEKMAKEDFRQATGASASIMPAERGSQHATVRGMMLLQGQAGERLKIIAKGIEDTYNKELAQFYLELDRQFMKDKEIFDVLGKDGKHFPFEVTPEQLLAKVNFRTTGVSEVLARETQISQLMQFKALTMNDPTVNKAEINKRIAILFGFKDLDSLIREMSVEQEVQLMSAMGGKGAGDTGAPMPSPEGAGRPPGEETLGLEGQEQGGQV